MSLYITFPDWIKPEIIPGLPFRWYGLMYVIAFGIAYFLFTYQIKKRKLDVSEDDISGFIFSGILGLLIGARLFGTLIFGPGTKYWTAPWLIFWPFNADMQFVGFAGMNYYGGVLGCITALLIYTKRKKINLLDWGDMLIAGLPLGYTFGRIGNFINAELYGRVTTAPWGMVFPHAKRFPSSEQWVQEVMNKVGMSIPESTAMVNLPRHPTQIYEGFFEGIFLWLVIWFIFRERKPFHGFIIGVYMIGYGFVRIVLDYFRTPILSDFFIKLEPSKASPHLLESLWNISLSQVFSLLMVLGGILFIVVLGKFNEQREQNKTAETGSKSSARKLRKKLDRM